MKIVLLASAALLIWTWNITATVDIWLSFKDSLGVGLLVLQTWVIIVGTILAFKVAPDES